MENVIEAPHPTINLREFLDKYKNQVNYNIKNVDNAPFYFNPQLPVSADLEASCSLQLLSSPDDNLASVFQIGCEIQRPSVSKPKNDLPVPKTYTAINEHKKKSRRNPFHRSQYSYNLIPEPTLYEMEPLQEFELELTVRFYRPPRAYHRNYKIERPVFAEEFICLGSNYLTELRDKISCICNGKRFVDISNDPEAPLPLIDSNPGYFFIGNIFYSDTRKPGNCDYAQSVINWAQTAQGVQSEKFEIIPMQGIRFIELNVSLGTPMQYLHHGNCEHLFVFSQVEVLRPNTMHLKCSAYPFMRSFNVYNHRPCYLCGQGRYNFIVEESTRHLSDPSYLCSSCFYSFHYVDGKKVGQFKAYRIFDNTEILDDDSKCQDKEDKPKYNDCNSTDDSNDLELILGS